MITLFTNNAGIGDVKVFGGKERELVAKFKFSANYATGGEAIDFGSYIDGRKPDVIVFEPVNGYTFYYNRSTGKVQAFTTAGTEVSDGTNLTSLEIPFIAKKFM